MSQVNTKLMIVFFICAASLSAFGDTVLFDSRGFEGAAYSLPNPYELQGTDGWVTTNGNVKVYWKPDPLYPNLNISYDRQMYIHTEETSNLYATRAISGANSSSLLKISWTWHTCAGDPPSTKDNYIIMNGRTGDPNATNGLLYPSNWSVGIFGGADINYSVRRYSDGFENITGGYTIPAGQDIDVEVLADYSINSMVITVTSGDSVWTSNESRIDDTVASGFPVDALTGVQVKFVAGTIKEAGVDNLKVLSVRDESDKYEDDFESYTAGTAASLDKQADGLYSIGTLWTPDIGYVDKGFVVQNADGVNDTKVLKHANSTLGQITITPVALGAFTSRTGEVEMNIDIKPASGQHGVYLADDGFVGRCLLWFKSDNTLQAVSETGIYDFGGATYTPGNWYRVTFNVDIDEIDGNNSTYDVDIYDLTNSQSFASESNISCQGDLRRISRTQVLSQTPDFEAYIDNWSVKPVISNCADVQSEGYALPSDVDGDCDSDVDDLSRIGYFWLDCNDPEPANCL